MCAADLRKRHSQVIWLGWGGSALVPLRGCSPPANQRAAWHKSTTPCPAHAPCICNGRASGTRARISASGGRSRAAAGCHVVARSEDAQCLRARASRGYRGSGSHWMCVWMCACLCINNWKWRGSSSVACQIYLFLCDPQSCCIGIDQDRSDSLPTPFQLDCPALLLRA